MDYRLFRVQLDKRDKVGDYKNWRKNYKTFRRAKESFEKGEVLPYLGGTISLFKTGIPLPQVGAKSSSRFQKSQNYWQRFYLEHPIVEVKEVEAKEREGYIPRGHKLWRAYDAIVRELIKSRGYGGFVYKGLTNGDISLSAEDSIANIKGKLEKATLGWSYWGLVNGERRTVFEEAKKILADYLYDRLHQRNISKYFKYGDDLLGLDPCKEAKKPIIKEEVKTREREEKANKIVRHYLGKYREETEKERKSSYDQGQTILNYLAKREIKHEYRA